MKLTPRQPSLRDSADTVRKRPVKFIPTISQLQEAIKALPDPELWPDPAYACAIQVDDESRTLDFVRKSIHRGRKKTYRWIYEGKVLIRKRDV